MSKEMMIKRFEEVNVVFMLDGWFNATSVAKKFGKEVRHWLELPTTNSYISELLVELQPGLNPRFALQRTDLIKVYKGSPENGGGTWLHPELAVEFARWCSVRFARWCDKQIKEILIQNQKVSGSPFFRQNYPEFYNEELGFHQCSPQEDNYCKSNRIRFDLTIKQFCGLRNPRHIQELTNLVFRIFTGFKVSDFRRGWGIAPGSRVRTRLFVDTNLRRAIDDVEIQVETIIRRYNITDFSEIYTVVGDVVNSVAGHCRAHRIRLGQSVPINLRLVSHAV